MDLKKQTVYLVLIAAISLITVYYVGFQGGETDACTDCFSLCEECNIIFISVDALRADRLGLYGYDRNTSPNIDNFFGNKTIFEISSSSAPCTKPSVQEFLNGRFGVDRENVRMAEKMKSLGYSTAAIVSHHFFGWSESPKNAYARGFDYFNIQNKSQKDQHGMTSRSAEEVTDYAIRWLNEKHGDGKFFMWLHYFDPHDPHEPPSEYRGEDKRIIEGMTGDVRTLLRENKKPSGKWNRAGYIFNEAEVEHFNALYDSEVRYTDAEVGRLLREIEKLGLVEDSIIILTADHGERLGEDDRWGHCQTLHKNEIHVPLIFSVKGGKLGRNGRTDTPASTLDVYPTLLYLLNETFDERIFHGSQLVDANPSRSVFSSWKSRKTIIKDGWKLYYTNKPKKLFNIGVDENEIKDRLEHEPQTAVELEEEMLVFMKGRAGDEEEHEKIVERLKSIGYM